VQLQRLPDPLVGSVTVNSVARLVLAGALAAAMASAGWAREATHWRLWTQRTLVRPVYQRDVWRERDSFHGWRQFLFSADESKAECEAALSDLTQGLLSDRQPREELSRVDRISAGNVVVFYEDSAGQVVRDVAVICFVASYDPRAWADEGR
jgi:hypothetical protein